MVECVLCSSSFHHSCLDYPWSSTMMDFWLCSSCHSVEAGKGVEEQEEVHQAEVQLWAEDKIRRRLKIRRVKVVEKRCDDIVKVMIKQEEEDVKEVV